MYEAVDDPYCYPGPPVLRNKLGIRDPERLEAFEEESARGRANEPLPVGRFGVRHYCAIHRHLFEDVYSLAGRLRTVRISKGGSMFCFPEHVAVEMRRVFELLRNRNVVRQPEPETFAAKAIHPFRDGNGRTQLAFMSLLAHEAGHPLHLARPDPETFLAAMVASFHGNEAPLRARLLELITSR